MCVFYFSLVFNYIFKTRTEAAGAKIILFKFNNAFILNYLSVLLKCINSYLYSANVVLYLRAQVSQFLYI